MTTLRMLRYAYVLSDDSGFGELIGVFKRSVR
jgi:hypothetical protein